MGKSNLYHIWQFLANIFIDKSISVNNLPIFKNEGHEDFLSLV